MSRPLKATRIATLVHVWLHRQAEDVGNARYGTDGQGTIPTQPVEAAWNDIVPLLLAQAVMG